MSKFFNLICLIILSFFVYQYHSGDISNTDILRYSSEYIELEEYEEDQIDVAILKNKTIDLKNFLIESPTDFDQIFLIAENHSWQGRDAILSNNKISALNIRSSFWAFEKEKGFYYKLELIENYFPKTKILPILIKDFASTDDLDNLADKIATKYNGKTLIIALSDLSKTYSDQLTKFHDEINLEMIKSSDPEIVFDLNLDSAPVLYLALKLSEKPLFYGENFVSTDKPLSIMAFGDMMLGRYVRTLMDRYGKDYIFENIRGEDNEFFKNTDVVFGNLEGPIKGHGRSGGTSMVFAFNEDISDFLKKYNFNLVSLANNHAVDAGWSGRDTTIDALNKSGVDWCGHPSEADPSSVYYKDNFAFVCLHDVTFKLDDNAAVELIKEVRKKVDYLIVTIHWGYEYQHTASFGNQIEPGRAFIDAGADMVIGHHPHVVQNFEIYKNKLIFYSLGNFVFDQYWSSETQEELALGTIMQENRIKVYLFPMKSEMSQSRLMNEVEKKAWFEEFISYGDYSETTKNQIRNGFIEVKD